jgi:hypothetical protein
MTARQPGEAAKVPRSARYGDDVANDSATDGCLPNPLSRKSKGLAVIGLPGLPTVPVWSTSSLRKRCSMRKREKEEYEVVAQGKFSGFVDEWTEYLCLARNRDGSIALSSRSREILACVGSA